MGKLNLSALAGRKNIFDVEDYTLPVSDTQLEFRPIEETIQTTTPSVVPSKINARALKGFTAGLRIGFSRPLKSIKDLIVGEEKVLRGKIPEDTKRVLFEDIETKTPVIKKPPLVAMPLRLLGDTAKFVVSLGLEATKQEGSFIPATELEQLVFGEEEVKRLTKDPDLYGTAYRFTAEKLKKVGMPKGLAENSALASSVIIGAIIENPFNIFGKGGKQLLVKSMKDVIEKETKQKISKEVLIILEKKADDLIKIADKTERAFFIKGVVKKEIGKFKKPTNMQALKIAPAKDIVKKFHPDDRAKMIDFIDNTRLKKAENIELEKDARAIAEGLGLNPDVSNLRLANKFDDLLERQRAEFKKAVPKIDDKMAEEFILNDLNPTSGLSVGYTPQVRAKIKLGKNITTLDKTSGKSSDTLITIYRGAPKNQKDIVPGDFITTNYNLAKDYAGTGKILSKKVKMKNILDDITEPLGEEYIYRPKINIFNQVKGKPVKELPAISQKEVITQKVLPKATTPKDTHIEGIVKPSVSKNVSSVNDTIKSSYDEIFTLPKETRGQAFRRKIEDFNIRLKTLNNEIKKLTGTKELAEHLDLYARKDMLPRRTSDAIKRVREQRERFVKRLVDKNIDVKKLDDYLHARHALERNAKMKKVSGKDIDGLSGMTDKKAKGILKDVPENYKQFTKEIDDIIEENLKYQVENGLIKSSEADIVRKAYDNYVPLYRDVDNSYTGIGVGADIRGKEIKRAKGSERRATSIIANVFYQIEKTRVRVLKNEIGKTVDNLVKEYPELSSFFKIEKQKYIPRFNAEGELQYLDPKFQLADNVFGFKKDGTQYFIITDASIAKAIKNTDLTTIPMFMQPLRAGIAIWSGFKTRWNPEFLITNFQRDLGEALINLNVEKSILKKEGKNLRKEVVKDLFPSQNEIRKHLRGVKKSEQFDEFLKLGGDTGHFWMETAKQGEENIFKLAKRLKGEGLQKPLNYGREALKFIDDINSVIELGVRYSAYKNLVKRGMSKEKSIQSVADLTVNFSRQGEISPILKSFYGFINPAIQGTSKVFRTIASPEGKKRVARAITGLVALGYLNRQISIMLDPEGDEAIPAYSKNHKLIFALGDGKTATLWQMPYGFTTFFALGSNLAEIQAGKKTFGEAVGQVAKTGVNSFSPFDTDLYSLIPTLAKPLFEADANKAWYDGPIYPEQKFTRTPKPDAETYFRNTSETSKFITELLNVLSGGGDGKAGAIDIHPDSLEYLFNQYTGGPVTFAQQTLEAIGRGLIGEFNPSKTPFIKKFYRKDEPKSFVYGTINDTLARAYKKDLETLEINRFYRAVDVGLNKEIISQEYADKVIKDFIKARYKILGTITSEENKNKLQDMKEVDRDRLIETYSEATQKKLDKVLKQNDIKQTGKKSLEDIFESNKPTLEDIFKKY